MYLKFLELYESLVFTKCIHSGPRMSAGVLVTGFAKRYQNSIKWCKCPLYSTKGWFMLQHPRTPFDTQMHTPKTLFPCCLVMNNVMGISGNKLAEGGWIVSNGWCSWICVARKIGVSNSVDNPFRVDLDWSTNTNKCSLDRVILR